MLFLSSLAAVANEGGLYSEVVHSCHDWLSFEKATVSLPSHKSVKTLWQHKINPKLGAKVAENVVQIKAGSGICYAE